jgi:hypothetical protein
MKQDLEQVSPQGRLDVLVYRGMQHLLTHVEQSKGISGLWENAKPVINNIVTEHISGIDVPSEVKMILGIIQANWK